jgi:dUTP diphosphatase
MRKLFNYTFSGTIDKDYTGNVKIQLLNMTDQDFLIQKGDKIGQGIIERIQECQLVLVKVRK